MNKSINEYIVNQLLNESIEIDKVFVEHYLSLIEETNEKFPINIDKLVEFRIYTHKRNAVRTLVKMFTIDKDYIKSISQSTGGRPAEIIHMTIECFKLMSILSENEQGKKIKKYYFSLEEIYKKIMRECYYELEKQKDEITKKNENIQKELLKEQKESIKMKKYISNVSLKNQYRHQFQIKDCVYILQNPDEKYNKFKIGLSTNINERLKSDRTMIPNIKVKYILYIKEIALFEKVIKIKYKDRLMMSAHEWVFDELDNLIKTFREINKTCGFEGVEESELWRYNMENPPEKIDETKELTELEKRQFELKSLTDRSINGVLSDRLHKILPSYISKSDFIRKNETAPDGHRYCNGFCQSYKLLTEFSSINTSYTTVCDICKGMEKMAYVKIKNGELTADQIRNNPSLVVLNEDERMCRKCENIKNINMFEKNKCGKSIRVVCNECRSKEDKDRIQNYCENSMEKDIKILYELRNTPYEFTVKLKTLIKDQLTKIIKRLKIGRKSSDTKELMIQNITEYFKTLN